LPLNALQIGLLVDKYQRELDRFEKMSAVVSRHLSAQLRASAIPHLPTFRAKALDSLREKLSRDFQKHEFLSLEREFGPTIKDLAGVRIMLYRPRDEDQACRVIEELFVVPTGDRFRRDFTDQDSYQARHRVVLLRDEMLYGDPGLLNLTGVLCEVQVVTLGDHIWNELNHDILYKTPTGEATHEQASHLRILRGQLNAVRTSVEALMEATERQRQVALTSIASPEDLSDALKSRTGRRLRGDFDRLLKLLSGVLREVTRANLDRLPIGPEELGDAAARLLDAGLSVEDEDVSLVVAALWPTFAQDFIDIAGTWRGRPSALAKTIQALAQHAKAR